MGVQKFELPRELVQAVIRTQAEKDLDWTEACRCVALLADPRREEYKRAVRVEALSISKSEMMHNLNRSRNTIYANGFKDGVKRTRETESNFSVPCGCGCGKPMLFSSTYANWPEVYQVLKEALSACRLAGH